MLDQRVIPSSNKKDGIEVAEITTDSDSSAYRAVESLHETGCTSTSPKHFLDMRHVAANHRKYVNRLSVLEKIMPAPLKTQHTKLQSKFASDIAARCKAEYTQAYFRYKYFNQMTSGLSYVTDAIISCYCEDHSDCATYSFVCLNHKKSKT